MCYLQALETRDRICAALPRASHTKDLPDARLERGTRGCNARNQQKYYRRIAYKVQAIYKIKSHRSLENLIAFLKHKEVTLVYGWSEAPFITFLFFDLLFLTLTFWILYENEFPRWELTLLYNFLLPPRIFWYLPMWTFPTVTDYSLVYVFCIQSSIYRMIVAIYPGRVCWYIGYLLHLIYARIRVYTVTEVVIY